MFILHFFTLPVFLHVETFLILIGCSRFLLSYFIQLLITLLKNHYILTIYYPFVKFQRYDLTIHVLVHKEIVFSHLSNKDKFLRFPARPPMLGAGGSAAWSNFFCRSSSRCAILPSNNRFFHLRIKLGFIP